jgi:hypothetical protein
MDKALSFFRLFDLAFFLPGGVLFWGLALVWPSLWPSTNSQEPLSTVGGIGRIVAAIAGIYMLGLITHGLSRCLRTFVLTVRAAKPAKAEPSPSWYQNMPASSRADITQYFWYMRATCWNLSLALAVVALILPWQSRPGPNPPAGGFMQAGIVAMGALLCWWLGTDYDRALHRAAGAPGSPVTPAGA